MNSSASLHPPLCGNCRRLAIVVSHPIQYYAPWFRVLAADPSLETHVFYLSDHGVTARPDAQFGTTFSWDTDLLSGYAHAFVPNRARHPDVTRFNGLHNPGLRSALNDFNPDAILLFGYAYRTHLTLLATTRTPVIFRGDSHLLGARPALGLKRLILRTLFARCAAFLPVGQANAAYFRHYGVPDQKFFTAPHCVDETHFTTTPPRATEAAAARRSLGIPPGAPVALFAGKLTSKKRPDLLLAAFLRADVPGSHLVLAGDGELSASLRATAAGRSNVHFLPFANQSAMPARYLIGDVFVLPSEGRHETWGLAINEAMHLGLPCIVSNHVGCHLDLVKPGVTGWVFPAGNETALAEALGLALSLSPEARADYSQQARRRVAHFTYSAATSGLLQAMRFIFPHTACV